MSSLYEKSPLKNTAYRDAFHIGARGGNRTRTPFGQDILSVSCLPIPTPARM